MALWLVRAGAHGEYEKRFLEENRIYLTWGSLSHDLTEFNELGQLRDYLDKEAYPDSTKGQIRNYLSQIWAFRSKIAVDDWIVLPSKLKPAIHVAEVRGGYAFDSHGEDLFRHYREVEWTAVDIPRTNFDQDLLYSFGAFMTICGVSRNDAEQRVRKMGKSNWKSSVLSAEDLKGGQESTGDSEELQDLAQVAQDQLAKLVITRFKGHGMARLVDAVLRAQGYITYLSPEGPDKGIDILAAPQPMGFGEPSVCVQVKSGDLPLDRPTLDQLIGVMQNVQASHGLLVSWGGFKSSVDREEAMQFFKVRLWDQDDLIQQILSYYGELDEEIRMRLPLKRIWIVTDSAE
ncbi:MAG: restriction endonuclease [Gammaproteobacteria bacterium]|nr:restriction endonuclease [Gammaproteobacteria bacterium]